VMHSTAGCATCTACTVKHHNGLQTFRNVSAMHCNAPQRTVRSGSLHNVNAMHHNGPQAFRNVPQVFRNIPQRSAMHGNTLQGTTMVCKIVIFHPRSNEIWHVSADRWLMCLARFDPDQFWEMGRRAAKV